MASRFAARCEDIEIKSGFRIFRVCSPLHLPSKTIMLLTILQRNIGDITILEFNGPLVLSNYSKVRDLITQLIQQGRTKLIFDYSDIQYVDSSGNGFLVSAYTAARNSGGRVVLAEPSKRYFDLLQITKLASAFDIFETSSDALAFFGAKDLTVDQTLTHNFY